MKDFSTYSSDFFTYSSDFFTEAMDPETRKQYDSLYRKRRRMVAAGKDVTDIEAEMDRLKNGTTPSVGAQHSADRDQGYQDAIQAMKDAAAGNMPADGDGSGDGMSLPPELTGQQPAGGAGGSGSDGSDKSDPGSRDTQGKPDKKTGMVRAEDCSDMGDIGNTPGTPGGFIDSKTGNEVAEAEGHEPDNASDAAVENEWKNAAIKAASQMKGDVAGALKSKLEGLYKTSQDWKKSLRSVVGHSLNPEDKRSAYANKNVLISQDRIARTDKDKYDNMDYMMAWIDSSGSMSDEQLRMCLSEVYAVALAKKPIKLVVVQCDTKIQSVDQYTDLRKLKQDMIHATVKGRGGTDLKPCWNMLLKDPRFNRRPAELVMIFTDGYLDQYPRNPRTMQNLCWVVIDNPGFQIQYKDIKTKLVCIDSNQVKA